MWIHPGPRHALVAALLLVGSTRAARAETPPSVLPTGIEPTRLFFAPTARALPRGHGSFGLSEVVFPWVEVGVLDRVSVQSIVIPPLEDVSAAGVILAPKIQLLRHERVHAAVGVIHAFRSDDAGGFGYGVVTLGGRDTSATLGLGYGYGGVSDPDGSAAVVFVGGEKSLGRHVRLIVEGYVGGRALDLPEQTLIAGARMSFGRWSLDLAAVVPFYETGSGGAYPTVTIARAF